jgi:tight adherence protein C
MDLLVICANSGLSVDRTFEQVAQEIGHYNPHLGKEFALTSIELNLLPSRRIAYENLARRVKMPLIQGLTITLIQAEEQGTSLSETLTALSEEFRMQMSLAAEAHAARLPAILSVPIVLFTLPSLLIIILGPAFAAIYRNF